MSDQQTVEIRLSDEAQALFSAYKDFTGERPETYIEALVSKTLPTLQALVDALHEAGDDSTAVMEIFGRNMANTVLRQQD
ncbi:MAG: hypothetical protein ACJAWL_002992 [Motiliproteus sp.]|jgi:hypothetical protein